MWTCFLITILTFWVVNWHNKKGIKVIYPHGSKAFKPQIPATRLAMWLNDFEFDVVWTVFQLLLMLHSHISVLWPFCRISVIYEFSFLSIGLKTKPRKSRKIFIFLVFSSQAVSNGFRVFTSLFWSCLTAFSVISVVSVISEFSTWPFNSDIAAEQ